MASEGTRERRRLMRAAMRAEDSYVLLFVLLMLDLLAAAFATSWDRTLLLMVLVAGTLMIALHTSKVRPRAMRFALVAVGAVITFGILAAIQDSPIWIGWMFAAMAALLLVTPVVVGRRILGHRAVTLQTLFGAVSIYVILGLLFAFMYIALNFLLGEPFYVQGQTDDPVNFIYASYITLTTVGYGDFTPAYALGKMLVAIEALIGQVFLVTAVARLVSLYTFSDDAKRRRIEALEAAEDDTGPG